MQKNVPKYTPEWVRTVPVWAEASKREVAYALCDDRPTLLWFANQRAVEYHPTLCRVDQRDRPTHLVLDLDPPEGAAFPVAVQAALLVRQALADAGLAGAVKTSGAKGVHVFVPIDGRGDRGRGRGDPGAGGARRAPRPGARHHGVHPGGPGGQGVPRLHPGRRRHGGGGVQPAAAARACRCRSRWPGTSWTASTPADFTVHTALGAAGRPPIRGRSGCPRRSRCPPTWSRRAAPIPVARVQAMHEGKRRARARRESARSGAAEVAEATDQSSDAPA